jgi:hypothetical protein
VTVKENNNQIITVSGNIQGKQKKTIYSTRQLRCCEVSAILHFTALWRWAEKLKIS